MGAAGGGAAEAGREAGTQAGGCTNSLASHHWGCLVQGPQWAAPVAQASMCPEASAPFPSSLRPGTQARPIAPQGEPWSAASGAPWAGAPPGAAACGCRCRGAQLHSCQLHGASCSCVREALTPERKRQEWLAADGRRCMRRPAGRAQRQRQEAGWRPPIRLRSLALIL